MNIQKSTYIIYSNFFPKIIGKPENVWMYENVYQRMERLFENKYKCVHMDRVNKHEELSIDHI